MDQINYLHLSSRWFHLVSIIALVGGSVFMRFVLMPAAVDLSDTEHAAFRDRILSRWKRLVHPLIALIVLSGIANLIFKVRDTVVLWHILFTVKLLVALFVLFVASALVGRSKALEPIRRDGARWLVINILLAAVLVFLSGMLGKLPLKAPAPAAAPAAALPDSEPIR